MGGSYATYPAGSGGHALQLHNTAAIYTTGYINLSSTGYFGFVIRNAHYTTSSNGNYLFWMDMMNSGGGTVIPTVRVIDTTVYTTTGYTANNITVEYVSEGGRLNCYVNGVFLADTGATPTVPVRIEFRTQLGSGITGDIYIDDFSSTGSIIGVQKDVSEATNSMTSSYDIQLYHSYPSSQFTLDLYSLTAPSNAGLVASTKLSSQNGIHNINVSNLGSNFGLYMLELKRGNSILYDTYFWYYQTSNPQSLPELLFLGTSSVNTNIKDEDQHGGEVDGGDSVYMYPTINSPADYAFTYAILETPYSITTDLNTVYNTSSINSLKVDYTGLGSMTYNVSIDGVATSQTGGSNTYTHTFTGAGLTTPHIISFSPDYSEAGVWGEVKNSESQQGIKSVTVSISSGNFSKTIYTDDNGIYYLSKGLEVNNTYTITVSKTGYSSTPSQTATTVNGLTTRQDFFLDKLPSSSGSGLYYAPHDVGFTVFEYWYSGTGLPGVTYTIYNGTESLKTGTTDSKGMFTGSDMSGGTNYTITLTHNGTTYTEYIEPSLTEYTFTLNKEGVLHKYANSWLAVNYTQNTNNVTVAYTSNKTLTGASLSAKASNGTTVYTQALTSQTGTFTFNTGGEGDYTLNLNVEAADGSTAKQSWGLSYPEKVPLFPDSYPEWLRNLLFGAIVIIFLLAFGKSRSDAACGSVAVITSLGYMFNWISCTQNFVILIWLIALGAIYMHYKRTGGLG